MIKSIMESIFLVESLKSAKEFATKNNISSDAFDAFNELDTTPTKKLIHQLLKWYITTNELKNNIDDIRPKIDTFIKFSGKTIKEPIEKFKTYDDFVKFITPFLDIKTKAQKKDELAGQYKKIFENEHMLVVLPYTHKASCIYGANTTWCTTAKDARMFNSYMGRGCTIYYIMNKDVKDPSNPFHKMSLVIETNGYVSQHVDATNSMQVDKIKKWIVDNGGDLSMFTVRKDTDEREAAKLKELQYKIDVEYKKLTHLVIDENFESDYKVICKSYDINKVFPNVKRLDIEVGKEEIPIPASVTEVNLGYHILISDLQFINNEKLMVGIALGPGRFRVFTNCNNINCTLNFKNYADYYKEHQYKIDITKMINESNFKSMKIDVSGITDYINTKKEVEIFLNKLIDEKNSAQSVETPVETPVVKTRRRKAATMNVKLAPEKI